jgi:hypothetical protein
MKSYLGGNPELRLALNEDLVIGQGGARGGGGGGGYEGHGAYVARHKRINNYFGSSSSVSERTWSSQDPAAASYGIVGCGIVQVAS